MRHVESISLSGFLPKQGSASEEYFSHGKLIARISSSAETRLIQQEPTSARIEIQHAPALVAGLLS